MCRAHQLQRILHLFFVLGRKDAQPPGIWNAPCRCKLKAGGQLGAAGVGQHQRQFLRPGVAGDAGKLLPVQQHRAAQRGQLSRQRFEQGGFARAVRANECQHLPLGSAQRDIPRKGSFAVADGKGVGFNRVLHRTSSRLRRSSSPMTTGAPNTAVTALMESSMGANRLRAIKSHSRQNAAPPRQQPGRT